MIYFLHCTDFDINLMRLVKLISSDIDLVWPKIDSENLHIKMIFDFVTEILNLHFWGSIASKNNGKCAKFSSSISKNEICK